MLFLRTAATGEVIRTLFKEEAGNCSRLAFSPDGKTLACGGADQAIHLLEVSTGKDLRQFKGHQHHIADVVFSADGQTLASTDWDGVVRLWNVRTGQPRISTHNPQNAVATLTFAANDTLLATGGFLEPMIRFWDPATGKELRQLPAHCEWGVTGLLDGPPDGKMLLSAGLGGEICRWDAASGKEVNHFELGEGGSPPLLSPDGKTLAEIAFGKGGSFYDVATGKKTGRFGNGQTAGAAFLPDGRSLVLNVINPDRRGDSCVLWDISEGKIVRTFPKPKPSDPKQGTSVKGSCIVVTPDGETLLVGTDEHVVLRWDIPTGEPLPLLDGRQKSIENLAISPDGKTLASGGEDGSLCLWDMVSGRQRGLLRGHRGSVLSLAFSRDGRRLASGSQDTTALVWDLTDGIAADPPKELTARQLDELWRDLAGEDAVKANRSIWTLAYAPKQSVPYLQARLRPVPAVDAKQLARLLRDLDSEDFTARTRACEELEKLGESAAVALREAARKPSSVEVGRQVKGLLEKLTVEKRTPSAERIRVLRALESLEHAATPEAGELLKRLAQGADGAQLTRQAKASLERLAKRAKRAK